MPRASSNSAFGPIAALDVYDGTLPSTEADVRPPKRKAGFDPQRGIVSFLKNKAKNPNFEMSSPPGAE